MRTIKKSAMKAIHSLNKSKREIEIPVKDLFTRQERKQFTWSPAWP